MNQASASGDPLLRSRVGVTAFIDWNAQIHISGDKAASDPLATARVVLSRTAARIARCLQAQSVNARFRVRMRLYHGWHHGFEPSPNKKAIKSIIASTDLNTLSPVRSVVFDENIGYGDCLLSALPERMHGTLGIHLPNTLRTQHGRLSEKMVDTALAADIVRTAALEPEDWIIVLAEDDDLVPPVFTAEALVKVAKSRVILLHRRARAGNFLRLENLTMRDKK